jgi:hypothetical protein
LDNCVGILSGPGIGEAAHMVEVGAREAGHLREVATEIRGQPVDDFGAPALQALALENLVPDLPYSLMSSLLTASAARVRAAAIRVLTSARNAA